MPVQTIQLFHPGGEHTSPKGLQGHTPWYDGRNGHLRKFLSRPGKYLSALGAEAFYRELWFWGEWEANSDYETFQPAPSDKCLPKYLHSPYLVQSDFGTNTDPFVFGDYFAYTICQQFRNGKKMPTRDLSRGSLILFGSEVAKKFIIDTVFVVKCKVLYDRALVSEMRMHFVNTDGAYKTRCYKGEDVSISKALFLATLDKIYPDRDLQEGCEIPELIGHKQTHALTEDQKPALILGVNYTEREDYSGMFSYVPCTKHQTFCRPTISDIPEALENVLAKQGKNQGISCIDESDMSPKAIWDTVTHHVLSKELLLGFDFDLPLIR
jgi:hypothetical protein